MVSRPSSLSLVVSCVHVCLGSRRAVLERECSSSSYIPLVLVCVWLAVASKGESPYDLSLLQPVYRPKTMSVIVEVASTEQHQLFGFPSCMWAPACLDAASREGRLEDKALLMANPGPLLTLTHPHHQTEGRRPRPPSPSSSCPSPPVQATSVASCANRRRHTAFQAFLSARQEDKYAFLLAHVDISKRGEPVLGCLLCLLHP